MNIGIVTCSKFPNLYHHDVKILNRLNDLGYKTKPVIWDDDSVDWSLFNVLIFRSPWDYFEKQTAFISWLARIEKLGIKTVNPLSIVKNNIHKFYLQALQEKNVNIIPTVFIEKGNLASSVHLIPDHWLKVVIKPAISANSYLTEILSQEDILSNVAMLSQKYEQHDVLLQLFMPEIRTIGETSAIFFDGKFSHSVNKSPKEGDFRVQSNHGGTYLPIELPTPILKQIHSIYDIACQGSVYARIDGIIKEDLFYLMEVEMFEPDFYIEFKVEAIDLFIDAIVKNLNQIKQ
jgi:glutathione synthase/RimK-type ligase-like ATP-grasp enzyme